MMVKRQQDCWFDSYTVCTGIESTLVFRVYVPLFSDVYTIIYHLYKPLGTLFIIRFISQGFGIWRSRIFCENRSLIKTFGSSSRDFAEPHYHLFHSVLNLYAFSYLYSVSNSGKHFQKL